MCHVKPLSFRESQQQIQSVKAAFTDALAQQLGLFEVQAPLLSEVGSGVQDDLNGSERPVAVDIRALPGRRFEVVQSLAKWKRLILGQYGCQPGDGLFTHMKALRPDEEILGPMHSVYVDQWDWEQVLAAGERHLDRLKFAAGQVYQAVCQTAAVIGQRFGLQHHLPSELTFVHSEDLLARYPHLSPRERETAACREWGAVFLIGIGGPLADGQPHDGRAPDYDDWSSETQPGKRGLNGDILVWNPLLQRSFELSSMGIRVDATALRRQLALCGVPERADLPWHRQLLSGQLPQTVGGGIGQSRLAMFLLQREHIAQVQFSVWPQPGPVMETKPEQMLPMG